MPSDMTEPVISVVGGCDMRWSCNESLGHCERGKEVGLLTGLMARCTQLKVEADLNPNGALDTRIGNGPEA